jgi:hypothetical protein
VATRPARPPPTTMASAVNSESFTLADANGTERTEAARRL